MAAQAETPLPAEQKLCAFGSEDTSDITGDHGLMRVVLLNCIDRDWYGGAVLVSRTHFDTPDRPERANLRVVKGGAIRLSGGGPPGPSETQRQGPGALIDKAAMGPSARRMDDQDAAVVYDGERWVHMTVSECVFELCRGVVSTLEMYMDSNADRVHDIAPAVHEICDGIRGGSVAHYALLSEAVAGMLDKHAISLEEFSHMPQTTFLGNGTASIPL